MKVTRTTRRAYLAQRRREHKRELAHECQVSRQAAQAGISRERALGVSITFFHDLHRALGELSCPKCPTCLSLTREGRIGPQLRPAARDEILGHWQRYLRLRASEQEDPIP